LARWDANKDGTLDVQELDQLHKDISSTDTMLRYTGYTAIAPRLANALRYTAYTSDLGESFRPIIPPRIVQATYAISWAYVAGDVAFEGYKAHKKENTAKQIFGVVTERAIFQAFASMIVPAIVIHTQVKYAQKFFRHVGRFQKWGPTLAGLALVPFLPYIVDHPVEAIVHWVKGKLVGQSSTPH